MKSFTSKRSRLAAVVTGQGKQPGPIEAHERNVLAITRAIHQLTAKQKHLKRQLADVRDSLKARRRELRAVLQRDSSVTLESLDTAGLPDAIDAAEHHRER